MCVATQILLICHAQDHIDVGLSDINGLSDGTYTDLSTDRQFFITAPILGLISNLSMPVV